MLILKILIQQRKALAFLALCAARGYQQGLADILKQALVNPNVEVLLDAIWVMRYAPWEEGIPLAQQAAINDPDPEVREEALIFLNAYENSIRRE